jgi:demethylmenaquinone methyltransferase / 2-methoxy-6-polyprenyl-1,4-benzoquinol methylase
MFDQVAKAYDITNDVLSLGQTRRWRKIVQSVINPQPGDYILDLAAGTGSSSLPLADAGATVIPCDFSIGMLEVGQRRQRGSAIGWGFTAGDALKLPFADKSFDVVTISFGLRNVSSVDIALKEMLRVTKPGGRLVVCEFSHPTWRPFHTVYNEYLMKALPSIARKTSSNPDAYVYLAESIRAWPFQDQLADQIEDAGWEMAQWRNLTGGIVAIHRATRPAETEARE